MLNKVRLQEFRNFRKESFEFSPDVTVIVGRNASGKSNILESIYLLSTGKSFRARVEEEMIRYTKDISHIKGLVYSEGQKVIPEAILTRGKIKIGEADYNKAPKKRLLINGVGKRLFDFVGNLKIVLFGPWDLDLVTESPSLRRKFLDTVLSQTDRDYRRSILSYEKGLRQRNKILWNLRENNNLGFGRQQLLFWDKLLIKNGDYISSCREDLINFINERPDFIDKDFSLIYDRSVISESRLEQYKNEEIAAATTLVGPHRDDMIFKIKNQKVNSAERDLARFGSRGEARMGVLWLKLAELSYIEEKTHEKATLLLDDIFSELDHEHREIVIEASYGQQTIITTADPHYMENIKKVEKIELV